MTINASLITYYFNNSAFYIYRPYFDFFNSPCFPLITFEVYFQKQHKIYSKFSLHFKCFTEVQFSLVESYTNYVYNLIYDKIYYL